MTQADRTAEPDPGLTDHLRSNPPGLRAPNQFTHAVGAGDLYFLSGQSARGLDGAVVGPGDMARQTRQALDNLAVLLMDLDLEWGDVLKLTIFVTDMSRLAEVQRVRAEVFAAAGTRPPAITTVGVTSLAAPGGMIEIEAIAQRRRRARHSRP